jgi:hypothetical protein
MRSFWVTAPFVAAVLSHFASFSAIRTDFGVRVMSAMEFLVVVGGDGRPDQAASAHVPRVGLTM